MRTNKSTQPKFRVGDVIEYFLSRQGWKYYDDWKGIIISVGEDPGVYTPAYEIEWFNSGDREYSDYDEVVLCKGMNNTKLCEKCKYRFKCWTN